jgi:hypothetical protein
LLLNWREASQSCPPDVVARLLGQAAVESAGRNAPCRDLRACLGLGFDPVGTVSRSREVCQHGLVGGMSFEIRDVSVLAKIIARAPVPELGSLCAEGYLPRFADAIPDIGVCVSKNSVASGKSVSLLEYLLVQDCDSDRVVGTLGMFNLEEGGVQAGIAQAIQFCIDEVSANSLADTRVCEGEAVFKFAALILACDDARLHGLRAAPMGTQGLLHAMAREGTEKTVNDQLVIRGGVEEKLLYGAIERMTAPDVLTGHVAFDVNARDEVGRTPLFYAFGNGDTKMCLHLLAAGADMEIKDTQGVSLDDMAAEMDAENGDGALERTLLEWRSTKANDAVERVLRKARGVQP